MKWEVKISKRSEKFIEKDKIKLNEIKEIARKVIDYFETGNLNLDIKKLKGKWKGFYRARKGKVRVIMRFDFENFIIFIEEIDYRGGAYK
jgi:mRNA interferase RelE/StbE